MSKLIKVPYEYESEYFGYSTKVRWLQVSVPDDITPKTFVPPLVPHSITRDDYYRLERRCAKTWLTHYKKNPRDLSSTEAMGILTVLNWGLPEMVASYGGVKQDMLDAINNGAALDDSSTFIFVTALYNHLKGL